MSAPVLDAPGPAPGPAPATASPRPLTGPVPAPAPAPPGGPRGTMGAGLVAAALPSLVAALTFGRVIGIVPAMVRVLPVVVLATLGYAAAHRLLRRRGTGVAAVVSLATAVALSAGWAFVAGALSVPRDDGALAAFGRGLTTGLRVILSSALPTLTVAETVVPAIMLAGTFTAVACWCVTLPPRATTLLASATLFGLGLALGAGSTIGALALAVSYVVAAALALLLLGPWVDDSAGQEGPSLPRTLAALVGVVLVGALALVVGVAAPQLWTRAAFDPRTTPTTEPTSPTIDIDPLDVATRWQLVDTGDDRTLVGLATERPLTALSWVALEVYDGLNWRPARAYVDLGRVVPPDRNAAASAAVESRVRLAVTDALPGEWLPVPYRPVDIIGGRVLVDPVSGTVEAVGSPSGRTYQVRYRQVTPTRAQLATAGPAPIPAGDPSLAVPQPFPASLASFAAVAQRGRTGTFNRMSALAAALRAPRFRAQTQIQDNDRTYRGLERVLKDRIGTQEQYAAMFVLMARLSKVPARLVVGFGTPDETGGSAITPQDVRVWGEAAIDGVGWVPFAASPQDRADGGLGVEITEGGASPTPVPSPTATSADAPGADQDDGEPAGPSRLLVGLLLLLMVPALAVARAAWVRRRRARLRAGWSGAADPRARVAGAWAWARTSLLDAGLALPASRAPDDVAVAAGDLPDSVARPLQELAAVVAPSLYAPDDVAAATADAAWAAADRVARASTATLTRRGRVGRALRAPRVAPTGRVLTAG